MKDLNILISGFEYKIVKILDLTKEFEAEILKLNKEKKELLEKKEQQNLIIKQLEENNKILKISKSFNKLGQESVDAKLKINQLVREIDKCIALLNT